MNDALLRNAYHLHQAGRLAEALSAYDSALHQQPGLAEAHAARAAALSQLGRHEEALSAYDRALALKPGPASVWSNRGNALLELGRFSEAIASYDRALALHRDYAECWRHRALALSMLGRAADAVASLDKVLALKPNDAAALEAKGNCLMQLQRHVEAADAYSRALAVAPGTADLHYNYANALSILERHDEAVAAAEHALMLDPDYPYARGVLVHSKLQACDWQGLEEETKKLSNALNAGKRAVSPFNHKALSDSPAEQRRCAELWVAHQMPRDLPRRAPANPYRHGRIRVAYVSADFSASAVATLMARVFEHHDRSRFEVFAISFGPNASTPMRKRLETGFEHFIDMRGQSDEHIATRIRALEIDITVDLMGYTGECRSGILARRPAPVQVNFLGFPGTMAAPHIDYILADRTVIGADDEIFYSETPVILPDCFLPTDDTRAIAATPTRMAAGLPETGFVFASFNNAYKLNPPTFDIWMRLLKAVPGSILWLTARSPLAAANLKREAEARGVSASRLVFAPLVEKPEVHLARLRLIDLFLDTLPYSAHTTAADALWAGVPLLTCPGNSFQGRVAASLLRALGLSELIVPTLGEYESRALELAQDPSALLAIRAKLECNRETAPLFDTERFTRHLEAAFTGMWERHERGDVPASFAVPGSPA